jgi:hypothetical protein
MPIETDLHGVRGIAAYFEESRSPLGIQEIEVVMSDTDTLAAIVKVDMPSLLDGVGPKGPGLLLSDSDEDDPVGLAEAGMIPPRNVVLPLSLKKLNHGDTHRSGKAFHLLVETLGDVTEQLGRRDAMTPMLGEKANQLPGSLKGRDIAVEIEAVHTLDFQGHMVSDKLGNVGHGLLRSVMAPEDVPPNGAWGKAYASPGRFFYLSV